MMMMSPIFKVTFSFPVTWKLSSIFAFFHTVMTCLFHPMGSEISLLSLEGFWYLIVIKKMWSIAVKLWRHESFPKDVKFAMMSQVSKKSIVLIDNWNNEYNKLCDVTAMIGLFLETNIKLSWDHRCPLKEKWLNRDETIDWFLSYSSKTTHKNNLRCMHSCQSLCHHKHFQSIVFRIPWDLGALLYCL